MSRWSAQVARPFGRSYDLFSGGSDLLDLGLTAARISAASRRVAVGGTLDEVDRAALTEMEGLLRASAQVVKYFGTQGQQGMQPNDALAARVDAAIEAVVREADAAVDTNVLEAKLDARADALASLLATPTPPGAAEVLAICSELANAVLRETGQSGETTATVGG